MDVPDRDRSSGAGVGVLGACLGRWGDRLFSLEVLAVPVLGLRGPPPPSERPVSGEGPGSHSRARQSVRHPSSQK
jgi:hypothetical protein